MTVPDLSPQAADTSTEQEAAEEEEEEDYGLSFGWDSADKQLGTASVARMSARLPGLLRETFALGWRVDRRAVVALLLCQAAAGTVQAFGLLATTTTIGAFIASGQIGARLHAALPSLIVLAVAAVVRAVLGVAVVGLSRRVAPRIGAEAELMLLQAVSGTELVAYEHAGFNDRVDAAERGANGAPDLVSGSQDLLAAAASLIAASFVITVLHPVLLPLLALGVVPRWASAVRSQRLEYTSYQETTSDRRMMGVLRWHLIDKYPADQVRAGTMAPYLLSRYQHHAARVRASEQRAAWRTAKVALVGSAVAGAASFLVWAGLVYLLVSGRMSVAHAGAAVVSLQVVSNALWGMVAAATRLFRTSLYLSDWRAFLTEAGGHSLRRGSGVPAAPEVVRAERVSYTYPGAERPSLRAVDFRVRRGELVALVGENGSGKTTLAKLLSGLLVAESGQVTWDGRDVTELDPHALWRNLSYVPQQYARFPFTVEGNITLGQPYEEGDEAVMAAAKAAGADSVVTKLPKGLRTMLARAFWGGQDLSGGEWQRLAISRAFYRRGSLLVMDEPTSALDARGEHAVVSALRELARERAVVLVTHRLSNLVLADRIVVLKDGEIHEEGDLTSLLNAGGLLAELWQLQQHADKALLPDQREPQP
ncbi:ABC transporter ATP-binding protein [Streptacidiphilus sp. PAMC 29251]